MKANIIKGSMMRYLTLWAFRIGVIISGYSLVLLTWCFVCNAPEWAGTFLATFMSGIGLISASIAGKGFQKKYENDKGHTEDYMKGQVG